jgi:hypothetical protein
VCKAVDLFNLLDLGPLSFLRDRSGIMLCALGNGAHHFNFVSIDHVETPFVSLFLSLTEFALWGSSFGLPRDIFSHFFIKVKTAVFTKINQEISDNMDIIA